MIVGDPRTLLADADLVLKVQPPDEYSDLGAHEVDLLKPGSHADLVSLARQEQGAHRASGGAQGHRHCHRLDSAHHARAEDGRALVDGEHRRLSGGDRGGEFLRPLLHRPDDGGRPRAAGEGAGHRRRRGRAGRHRRRARARRDRARVRHARRGQGSGQEHGGGVPRAERRRGRRRRRRLFQGDEPGVHQGGNGALRRAGGRRRHHHHHGAHPEPAGADPHHRGHGEEHEEGLGDRRPRRRERRQLRAHRARARWSSGTACTSSATSISPAGSRRRPACSTATTSCTCSTDMGGAASFHIDPNDAVVRSALVVHNGEITWPPPRAEAPPPALAPAKPRGAAGACRASPAQKRGGGVGTHRRCRRGADWAGPGRTARVPVAPDGVCARLRRSAGR